MPKNGIEDYMSSFPFGCILCERGTFKGDVFETEEGVILPLSNFLSNIDKKATAQFMRNEKGVWPLRIMWDES